VFERFTEQARQVVGLAQEEARTLKHNYIGTEHILLGLLREEDGLAARVLESLDITVERVRAQVVRIVGPGEQGTSSQIPFTPRAKKVLELALRESRSLGHNHIDTEHILLGIARENEGVAMRVLLDLGVDAGRIRNEVVSLLPRLEPVRARPAGAHRARVREAPPREDAGAMLATIERHIRGLLHRAPDNGDLLVILATLPEGVVARTFAELGIDEPALDAALERARAAGADAIEDQIELAARLKDEAIDAGDLETAARHRTEERRLIEALDDDLIGRVRRRLGLMPGVEE
jgi:ATP-dependent Clp protease ATP-binding subunit ClpA